MGTEVADRYDSWEAFSEAIELALAGTAGQDFRAYLPSPKQIEKRKKMLRWLQEHKFSDEVIDAIMVDECPPYKLVRSLAKSLGIREAKRRVRRFLKE